MCVDGACASLAVQVHLCRELPVMGSKRFESLSAIPYDRSLRIVVGVGRICLESGRLEAADGLPFGI